MKTADGVRFVFGASDFVSYAIWLSAVWRPRLSLLPIALRRPIEAEAHSICEGEEGNWQPRRDPW